MAICDQTEKLSIMQGEKKVVKFYVPTCPVFAGPVTIEVASVKF